jgi:hypothetical protein
LIGADRKSIGLHSVFENHDAMTPNALRVFLHENRIGFPVGVDEPDGNDQPHTMREYEFQGTPTILLYDRAGRLRRHIFDHVSDLQLGAEIMALICEWPVAELDAEQKDNTRFLQCNRRERLFR